MSERSRAFPAKRENRTPADQVQTLEVKAIF